MQNIVHSEYCTNTNEKQPNRALPVQASIIRPKSTVCFGQQLGNSEPPYTVCGIWGRVRACTVLYILKKLLYLYCRWQSPQTGCLFTKKKEGEGGHCPCPQRKWSQPSYRYGIKFSYVIPVLCPSSNDRRVLCVFDVS